MHNILSETFRVAYGDLCYMKRNAIQVMVSSLVGPLLYLIAFGYGMRSGDSGYIAYVIPGIVAISSMNSGFSSSSQKILIQRLFHSSFDELILCPMHTTSIIFGKALLGVVKGMMCGTILVIMGMAFTSDMHITVQLFLLMLASCFVFSLLGVAAGVIVEDLAHMSLFTTFVILPMTFLCGTMFSLDALPSALATVIDLLPLSQTSACIRAVALDWAFPWISLGLLAVYGVVFYLLAHVALSRA
ncbi:MAG: ABC transporter permease [Candidatus Methanomethylophilus sp.]|nr:ABC transporter permease [Methanomethylophilus sp.]